MGTVLETRQSGLVTLLFTDVVGSTALKQQLGDRAGVDLVQAHHALFRRTFEQFAGAEEIVVAGDSFLVLFPVPSDAVKCALLLQTRLRQFNQGRALPVTDRMGLHMGEVRIEHTGPGSRNVHGMQVDACARVMSLAQGGQILMTRPVFDNARQSLKGEEMEGTSALEWLNHGRYELKGVTEPVEICEVRSAESGSLPPPTTSEKARRLEAAEGEAVLGWRPAVGQAVPNTKWFLEEKLGEGGFGEVWLGRHQTMKERRVFKFCFRADRVRSLKREMTLFRLIKERIGDHPNIVALREVYFDEPPFYVEEEYVSGQDLASWCAAHGGVEKVPLEVKLEIVAQVGDALQAAHDAGVIHRDVKPANILVSDRPSAIQHPTSNLEHPQLSGLNSQLLVKLTDFGIGQVVSAEALAGMTKAGFTQTMLGSDSSSQTGTQLYMAPELLAGKPASIRSDIYSLGVVLYQLVVGDFKRPVTTDWARQVEEPLLREDLALCFAGQPQERFAGAGQLAKNLRALPQRRAARAAEEARQAALERAAYQRGVIRTAALAVVVVLGFAALALYATRQARRAEATARAEAHQRYSAEMNLAQEAYAEGKVGRALALLKNNIPAPGNPEDLRGFEWRYLWRLCQQGDALHTFRSDTNPVAALAFSANERLVTCGSDGTVKILDTGARRELASFPAKERATRTAVSANGEVVATRSPSGLVRVQRLGANPAETVITDIKEASSLALSRDGSTLAVLGANRVRLWDIAEQKESAVMPWTNRLPATLMVFSPDNRWLAAIQGLRVSLWNVAEKRQLEPLYNVHTSMVDAMAVSPDGEILATGSWDTNIKLWEVAARRLLATLLGHGAQVRALAFSPDGRTLASGGLDEVIKLWDVTSRTNGVLKTTFKGHVAGLKALAFSPDGRMLASASEDGAVSLWPIGSQVSPNLLEGHTDWAFSVSISPDDRTLASAGFDGTIRLWDLQTGAPKYPPIPVSPYDIFTVEFSPDGAMLATAEGVWRGARVRNAINPGPALARLWSVADRTQVQVFGGFYTNTSDLRGAVFSPDGKKLAVASGGWVRFWSLPEGRVITNLFVSSAGILATLQFSPDGRYLVTAPWGGEARLWDVGTYKEIPIFEGGKGHAGGPNGGFSPDSRILAVGTTSVKLWDVKSRGLLAILEGHKGEIMCLCFSPDGKTLATGSMDHSVKLWSLATGQEVASLEGHSGAVSGLAFSSDGNLLASSSEDNTIRLWRAAPKARVPRWREEASGVSPSAQQRERAAAAERERAARARDPGAIRQWLVLLPIALTNRDGAAALEEEQVAQESQLRPRAGERSKVGETELVWRAVQLEDYLIDFTSLSEAQNEWCVAYAVSYIISEADQANLVMKVGSDDQAKIYLNGQEIYRMTNPTSWERDRDSVEGVNLKAGANVLVFKVVNEASAWGGSIRFTDGAGQPVKGIRVTLAPP